MKEKLFGYDGKYAVFDTKDKIWVGDDKGVVAYNDWDLARCAATIINEQMDQFCRFRASEYSRDAKKYAGEQKVNKTPEEAVKALESK